MLRRTEEGIGRRADHHDRDDQGERRPALQHRDAEREIGDQPDRVAAEHDPAPVGAVDQHAGRQPAHHRRDQADRADQPGLHRRAGQGQHQQRYGQRGDRVAHVGERLADPEQVELPVAPQLFRRKGHTPTVVVAVTSGQALTFPHLSMLQSGSRPSSR
ncbi:hypothetical protein GCM10020358_74290 [Amorphoplanes nipponensis]